MTRVLFVDDEPMVLQGLQRMLRPLRGEWDMRFAGGGAQALEELARAPADVVVSDLRMPGVGGTELLGQVRILYPGTVRIVLSGQADRETVLRSVRVAHRHLSKPCDSETLKFHINQAGQLRGLLNSAPLVALVTRLESVPSLPATYVQVERELAAPEPSVKRIAAVVARDIGMTAKILQVINSGLFGLRHPVESVDQAVALLGLETIQSLVLTVHIFSRFSPGLLNSLRLASVWSHSQAVSALARRIAAAEQAGHPDRGDRLLPEQAGVAGLLHDAGKLIVARSLPSEFRKVLAEMEARQVPCWRAERTVLGATHAEVGAYLLGLWGLPDLIVEAVAWHHHPADSHYHTFSPLTAVHVADGLFHQVQAGYGLDSLACLDVPFLERAGLMDRLPAWRALARDVAA
jgi:HD-like signal output (HDOD) protein